MGLVQLVEPAEEPVSLAEAKAHLRVDHAEEDGLIGTLVRAAREHVETYLRRSLVTQRWELVLDAFEAPAVSFWPAYPRGPSIALPRPPIISVEEVVYLDADGVEQSIAPAGFRFYPSTEPTLLEPSPGAEWPTPLDGREVARVRYTAGYGDALAVPAWAKSAMLLLVGHLYQHREAATSGVMITETPLGVRALLAPHRAYRFDAAA